MSRARVMWSVAAAALAVRVLAALALDGFRNPHLDEYDVIARNLLGGRGFMYPHHGGVPYYSYVPPFEAWIAAASYWLAGSQVPAMLLQVAAGSGLALVTVLVTGRLFGGWIAPLAAGLLVAVHPGLVVYNASRAHPLTFDALFFALAVLQTLRLAERQTLARAAQLGAVIGIGVLSRATVLLVLPIAAGWLLIVAPPGGRRAAIRSALIACVCAAAIVLPWTIRNSALHDRFVFLITLDAELFWRGNNPYATGTSHVDATRAVLDALPPEERRDLERLPDELAQAAWFRTRARAFVRDHPDRFVALLLRKLAYFWSYAPQTGILYPATWFSMYLTYYAIVVALAGIGAVTLIRAGGLPLQMALLIGAFVLALSVFQSLYYVEGRHRWGIEALVLVFSGGGAAALVARSRLAAVSR